jgi:hypothetical protein
MFLVSSREKLAYTILQERVYLQYRMYDEKYGHIGKAMLLKSAKPKQGADNITASASVRDVPQKWLLERCNRKPLCHLVSEDQPTKPEQDMILF